MSITHFPRFSVSSPYSRSCSVWVSFSTFICFRSKIQVLQYAFLIFHEFCCFSPYSKSYSVHFSFYSFLIFLAIFHLIHFLFFIFLVFLFFFFFDCLFFVFFGFFFFPLSRSYSVHFTLFHVFKFSCHIPAPKVWISHFPHFTVFFAIFHSLQYVYLIFHVFQFSCHILGPWLCISHFPPFLVFLAILKALPCEFLIFFRFPGLSPYSRSYSVHFSFSTFFSFTRHITGPIVCVFHFPRFSFFLP